MPTLFALETAASIYMNRLPVVCLFAVLGFAGFVLMVIGILGKAWRSGRARDQAVDAIVGQAAGRSLRNLAFIVAGLMFILVAIAFSVGITMMAFGEVAALKEKQATAAAERAELEAKTQAAASKRQLQEQRAAPEWSQGPQIEDADQVLTNDTPLGTHPVLKDYKAFILTNEPIVTTVNDRRELIQVNIESGEVQVVEPPEEKAVVYGLDHSPTHLFVAYRRNTAFQTQVRNIESFEIEPLSGEDPLKSDLMKGRIDIVTCLSDEFFRAWGKNADDPEMLLLNTSKKIGARSPDQYADLSETHLGLITFLGIQTHKLKRDGHLAYPERFALAGEGEPRMIALAADSATMATWGDALRIWRAVQLEAPFKNIGTIQEPDAPRTQLSQSQQERIQPIRTAGLVFSDNSEYLVAAGAGKVRLINVEEKSVVAVFTDSSAADFANTRFTGADISPDGRWVLAHSDNKIWVWKNE